MVKHYEKSAKVPNTTLAGKVRRVLSEGHSGVVRVEIPAAANPLSWLREQRESPRIYWSGRGGEQEIAASGTADFRVGTSSIPLLTDSNVRYYGGMAFDAGQSSEEWAEFGASGFFLPRLELRRDGGETTLACNLVLPRDADRSDEILGIVESSSPLFSPPPESELPSPLLRSESPGLDGWDRAMESALSALEGSGLDKVVLARRVDLLFGGDVDGLLLLENLKSLTPDSFHFYFEPQGNRAFLGASPERLFYRQGRQVWSEAVAGTRSRGESAEEDLRLRDELLGSEKDLREQRYVRSAIEGALGGLCEELEVSGVSEMRLARRRHLVSPVRGTLRKGVTDPEILSTLHPTPAAGGFPKQEAARLIGELEPFDRGWYAGPMGWIGRDEAEFAVGIRSALAAGDELSLYSGAGIVPGSDPLGEWEEIAQKIAEFEKILGIVS